MPPRLAQNGGSVRIWWLELCASCTDEEIEAQEDQGICPRTHGQWSAQTRPFCVHCSNTCPRRDARMRHFWILPSDSSPCTWLVHFLGSGLPVLGCLCWRKPLGRGWIENRRGRPAATSKVELSVPCKCHRAESFAKLVHNRLTLCFKPYDLGGMEV